MYPQDDEEETDEFDGSACAFLVIEGGQLPGRIMALARERLALMAASGDGYMHTSWRWADGGQTFEFWARQEPFVGWKVICRIGGECTDCRSYLLELDDTTTPYDYYAALPTGAVEEIFPIDSTTVRPEPDPATYTRCIKVPKELRAPPVDVEASRAPGGYRRTSSMYSGQMRMFVACHHQAGLDAPFSYIWTKTHGIVEFPTTRTTDAAGKFPPGDRFWVVELSVNGAYAMKVSYDSKCCELPKQLRKAMPTDAEIAENPSLQQHRTELSLHWAFGAKPDAGITRLLTAAEMAVVYAKGSPHADAHGWAFSYSGHEASNVVFTPHNSPDNYWEIWHPRVSFTTANPSEGVFTISAAVDYLTSNAQMHNNTSTLFWFQSEAYPNQYEEMFPYSYNGAGTVGNDYADMPIYVFYRGDVRHTLTMSYTEYAGGNDSGWSNVDMFNCINFNGPIWHCEGSTTRTTIGAGGTTFSMAFAGNTASGSSGSNTERTITVGDKTFIEFCFTGEIFGNCCGTPNQYNETWQENWNYTQTDIATSGTYSGRVMAVASLGDRESLFLGQQNSISGGIESESVFTMRNWLVQYSLCWTFSRGLTPPNCSSSLPTPDTGVTCADIDRSSTCCLAGPTLVSSSGGTTFPSGTQETGSGHIGTNDIALAANADIDQFFVPINPAMATPAVNPGPIGWHGNMYYNEPNLATNGVVDPRLHYVLNDGTNDWVANGGFSLTKPGGGSLDPLAFVGRV